MEPNKQLFELSVLIGENESVTLFLSKKDMEKATTGKIVMYLCIVTPDPVYCYDCRTPNGI